MVTARSLTLSKSEEHTMLINNNKPLIDQPLICVDGYLLSCQYDGESCTPMYGIKIEELLNSFNEELENFDKKDNPTNSSTPSKSDKSVIKLPPSPRRSSLRARSTTRQLFRQNSKDNVRRSLFSDPDEFLGISCQTLEHPLRNSFILPLSGNKYTTELSESVEKISSNRLNELNNQVKWVEEHGSDYINTETVHTSSELLVLLNILMKSSSAALVTLKINSLTEITVTYQFMKKFKQDYMVVKINKSYCMLMKAF